MAKVRVFSTPTPALAEMLKDVLAQEGIEASVNRSLAPLGTLAGVTEVWIADAADAERARQITDDFVRGTPGQPRGWDWRCASCGEMVEAQFAQCWKCGASR